MVSVLNVYNNCLVPCKVMFVFQEGILEIDLLNFERAHGEIGVLKLSRREIKRRRN